MIIYLKFFKSTQQKIFEIVKITLCVILSTLL